MKAGKKELSDMYRKRYKTRWKVSDREIDRFVDILREALIVYDGVIFQDVLVLEKVKRKPRMGRNPLTKALYPICSKVALRVRVGKLLDIRLNEQV